MNMVCPDFGCCKIHYQTQRQWRGMSEGKREVFRVIDETSVAAARALQEHHDPPFDPRERSMPVETDSEKEEDKHEEEAKADSEPTSASTEALMAAELRIKELESEVAKLQVREVVRQEGTEAMQVEERKEAIERLVEAMEPVHVQPAPLEQPKPAKKVKLPKQTQGTGGMVLRSMGPAE